MHSAQQSAAGCVDESWGHTLRTRCTRYGSIKRQERKCTNARYIALRSTLIHIVRSLTFEEFVTQGPFLVSPRISFEIAVRVLVGGVRAACVACAGLEHVHGCAQGLCSVDNSLALAALLWP